MIKEIKTVKPFLRWAGGKTWFTKQILNFLPPDFKNYYEPFVGGGSVFFFLKSQGLIKHKAYLSDSNAELINSYKVIKNNSESLFKLLKAHKNSEEEYYRMRSSDFSDPIKQAAKFIFLIKTSFNGIYRVNKNGQYNVPYGKRNLKVLYDYDHLKTVSLALKNTYLSTQDFKQRCKQIKENDLVFIDPPYTVAHENNGFIQYNQSIFSWDNQLQYSQIAA